MSEISQQAAAARMNPLTLRFSRRLEREFQRDFAERHAVHARLALLAGILLYSAYAYLDYVLSPAHYTMLWKIRLGIFVPGLLLLFAVAMLRWFKYVMQPLLFVTGLFTSGSVVWLQTLAWQDTGQAYFFGVIIVNLYAHAFGRMQFVWATVCGLINIAVYNLMLYSLPAVEWRTAVTANYFILSTFALGMVASYTFERLLRRDYLVSRDMLQTNERLLFNAQTDSLTGIPNRRGMLQRLEAEMARNDRQAATFTIALADVDHFKKINDTWGHDCGDAVLVKLADILKDNCRSIDVVCRWGGEEFLMLFPGSRMAGARVAAEKLRRTIAASNLEHDGEKIPLTMTIGLAECAPGKSLKECLREADTALYEGKRLGRNRSVCYVEMHATAEDASNV